jgi:hypothetical protein
MIMAGLLTLPYIYLLGKELGNRWVGLLAMVFAGIAYWPNVISRFALRFTLYPCFVAPTLYYLIRGLRRQNRNDFILSGLFLGIGLHGYSAIRVLPGVVLVGVLLYLIHSRSSGARRQALFGLLVLTGMAVLAFLPLLRYIANPINRDMFFIRTMTRMSTVEQPLTGPAWKIFLDNLKNAMLMFGWDNGEVWTVSIPHRPALDVVSAVLCYAGMAILLIRYLRKRSWVDLLLLVSVPILMLPSILALAFPRENPLLSRASGAIIPVFLMIGIALESLLSTIRSRIGSHRGAFAAAGLGIFLLVWSGSQNYDLVFNQYRKLYDLSSWNSSEMGKVLRVFADTIGSRDTTWLVGYPYWVDSRLVSLNAGYPDRDCAIMPDQLATTTADTRAKLFILNPLDQPSITTLFQLYPQGTVQTYKSKYETKDFLMFFVPPQK